MIMKESEIKYENTDKVSLNHYQIHKKNFWIGHKKEYPMSRYTLFCTVESLSVN